MGSEGQVCLNLAVSTLRGVPIPTPKTVLLSVRYKINALKQGPEPSSPLISTIAPGDNIVLLLPAPQINLMFTMALLSSENYTPEPLMRCLLPYIIT